MKKNCLHITGKILAACLAAVLFCGGCDDWKPLLTPEQLAAIPYAKTKDLPSASGGFVLGVNGEAITSDEVVSPLVEIYKKAASGVSLAEFKEKAKANVDDFVTNKIFDILLYQEGRRKLGENKDALDKAVEEEIRKFVVGLDNDTARAEAELKKGGLNWDGFRKEQEKILLSQSYLAAQMPENPAPITYSEMIKVYDEIKEKEFKTNAILQFRLIDIQPDKIALSDPNVNAERAAKQLAIDLLKKINDGNDFGQLASEYSNDFRRTYDGLWEPLNPQSVASPYDVLVTESQKIEIGQVAGPIEVEGHIFIMKLEKNHPASIEPFENVQKAIEARIRRERQLKIRREITEKLMNKATIGDKDAFVDYCLNEIHRKSVEATEKAGI